MSNNRVTLPSDRLASLLKMRASLGILFVVTLVAAGWPLSPWPVGVGELLRELLLLLYACIGMNMIAALRDEIRAARLHVPRD